MPRGGRQPGGGHPTNAAVESKRAASAEAIARFSDRAFEDLDAVYEAQRDLALGVYYLGCLTCAKPPSKCRCKEVWHEEGEDGEPTFVRVYREPPNQKAGAELIAHTKGRAAQAAVIQQETQIVLRHAVVRAPLKTNGKNAEAEEGEDE